MSRDDSRCLYWRALALSVLSGVVLLAGCELLGVDGAVLRVEGERDTFMLGVDTSLDVTFENVGGDTLYYNACLEARLEKLRVGVFA